MKYTLEIDIALPVDRVIELFDNPHNLKKWQPDLISFETISGVPGEEGTESRLLYRMGNKEIAMTETITVKQLPQQFSGVYETDNVWNLVDNTFIPLSENQTRWIVKNEFKCSGFVKLMMMLMPGMFKKQSNRYMEQFKEFAETQVS
ncbi:SRPBCC family protein [Thalassotalea litorea]|uniref:SRPBCC family protein n=1 Tax=Thalassotalea litorea TaxID=2020715 RepID=UPI003735ACCB